MLWLGLPKIISVSRVLFASESDMHEQFEVFSTTMSVESINMNLFVLNVDGTELIHVRC